MLGTDSHGIGKSVFGALFGGIVAAELFKKIYNIKGSTGAYFVPSLAIGIAIGRIGCFLAGMDDYTYGIVTALPWGYDFGDGLMRHPVQLYESASMWIFFSYSIYLYRHHQEYFEKYIFYQFVSFYALQRFLWEFLKPYDSIMMGLNIFQIGCLALIAYAMIFIYKQKAIK
jgi:prolipoprotein diacylglyceryltransferase